jgi:uncharacterized protein
MIDRPAGTGSNQHRVFLDANVLFSAAYRDGAGLVRLWSLATRVVVISSPYAIEEARRNLDGDGRARLEVLLSALEIVSDVAVGTLPVGVELPEKDRPILVAAMAASATHLLTGDLAHFGVLYGRRIGGVLVQRPADYLRGAA